MILLSCMDHIGLDKFRFAKMRIKLFLPPTKKNYLGAIVKKKISAGTGLIHSLLVPKPRKEKPIAHTGTLVHFFCA